MSNLSSKKMHGVVDGVYQCNQGRVQELNDRIYSRNIPSAPLQPAFSMRPTPTKYSIFPIVDLNRVDHNVKMESYPTYNSNQVFNPGNAQAPWSGFANDINTESSLRNQFFALQSCDQAKYVPSSNSDMFKVSVTSQSINQPFPDLFNKPDLAPFNPNTLNVGKAIFNNCTRVEMLDNCDKCEKN